MNFYFVTVALVLTIDSTIAVDDPYDPSTVCTEDVAFDLVKDRTGYVWASSSREGFEEDYAPIDSPSNGETGGAWSAATDAVGEWIEVKLGAITDIFAIVTQGRDSSTEDEWVQTYSIATSNDSVNWQDYTEEGTVKVFDGNSDGNTQVTNDLPTLLRARWLRIMPLTWNNKISMRFGLFGCHQGHCDCSPCWNGGTCDDSDWPYTCQCAEGFTGEYCEDVATL